MKTIDSYVKRNHTKMDCVQTTVSIKTKQKAFLEAKNLNLSDMVRDMLDSVMAKLGKGGKNV